MALHRPPDYYIRQCIESFQNCRNDQNFKDVDSTRKKVKVVIYIGKYILGPNFMNVDRKLRSNNGI